MRGEEDIENGPQKNREGNHYPIYEERDARWTSWLIPLFIVASIALFVVEMYINNCPKHIDDLGFYGDSSNRKCVARFLGRFSFQPLSENPSLVLLLQLIGIRLEQQCGFVRIGIIYLLSGFGGSVLSSLFIQRSISVGASGALFGLLGAMLSELITNWTIYTNKVAALLTILVIIVINLAVGILPHVDNFAHIGGFLTGFLLGFVLLPRPQLGWIERRNRPPDIRVKSKYKAYQYVLWLISLALLIAGFTVGLIMLFRGRMDITGAIGVAT